MRWGMVLAVLDCWGRAWEPCYASVVVDQAECE